jgi:phosphoribosylformimino-5-aminoimidazole carboxamide ribotide isomerase
MKVIPAIDIINGQCVRLTQGDYDQKKVYNNNPLEVAQAFEAAGIKHLHVVDLDGAKAGSIQNVNLGSIAAKNPELVNEWLDLFGPEKIIISADVRDEKIALHGWQEQSTLSIYDFLQLFPSKRLYVTCTDIATDGMLSGPNLSLYEKIQARFPDASITASGGVSAIHDLDALLKLQVDGVIIGKAIYENKISLPELSKYVN